MSKEWRVPLLLFFITLVTTTLTGASYAGAGPGQWHKGLWFSIPLIAILLTHEMGHYLAAKKHNVSTSPPWFIPLPPSIGIGTLGAVIRIREPITSRNALMEIGAAGPIMGLLVAIPVLIIGVALSEVKHIPLVSHMEVISEGNSLLYLFVKYIVHGTFLPFAGRDIMMHPVAFAGWIGLLITMINLIPVGQLDGGHIAFAWFGDRYGSFSRKLHAFLPVFGLGVFAYVLSQDAINHSLKTSFALLTDKGSVSSHPIITAAS
ncbi:site-2 protease family protein, partial [Myxococcota bacterium]|nr:site-2 protease family protein [Myxococcota bacterium]